MVSDSIDVLSEVVDKCGSSIGLEHSRVRDALLPFLDDARAPVRKRALHCLGEGRWQQAARLPAAPVRAHACGAAPAGHIARLAPSRGGGAAGICLYLNDDLLGGCVRALVERLQAPNVKPDFTRTYAQALGHIRCALLLSLPLPAPAELALV